MAKKNSLKFSKDGTQFQIIFKTGKESDFFTSKNEAFEAILDLARRDKITVSEFTKFRDQILYAKKLPWTDTDGILVEVKIVEINMGGISDLFGGLGELLRRESGSGEDAAFKMCFCGGLHGHIYIKTGVGAHHLYSQEEALEKLQTLKENGKVDDTEFEKVKKEIEVSPLPKEKKEK